MSRNANLHVSYDNLMESSSSSSKWYKFSNAPKLIQSQGERTHNVTSAFVLFFVGTTYKMYKSEPTMNANFIQLHHFEYLTFFALSFALQICRVKVGQIKAKAVTNH